MKRLFALVLILAMLLCVPALAEPTVLRVHGTGIVNVTANDAKVILGVRETAQDVRVAQATVNEKINAIYEALIAAGIEKKDIGTESLYIYANYDYSSQEEKVTGYTATNTIAITTDQLERIGEYIDIAFEAGANTLDTVNFSAPGNEDAQREALELAVQNAFERAEIIAKAAGMKIDAVTLMDETQEDHYYNPIIGAKYSNARVEAAAADQSTLVQASTLQISTSIIVEFELSKE